MNDSIVYILISIGLVFEIVGCIGLVRMPTVYNRIQASTKCVTIGTCFILAGIAVQAFFSSEMGGAVGLKAIICLVFILLTAPTGAHAIARAAHRSGIPLWSGARVDKYEEDQEGTEQLPDDNDSKPAAPVC
jgi:multicomponent Na+:H+ antiporter subunit G